MAQNATLYTFTLSLSDMDRDVYPHLNLKVPLHPSETLSRLVARLLAYCLNYSESLNFTKGLCDTKEPDIWIQNDMGKDHLWIEVGEPSEARVIKHARKAEIFKVYSFNDKQEAWWRINKSKFFATGVQCYSFSSDAISTIADSLNRSNEVSISIVDQKLYWDSEKINCEVSCDALN